MTYQVIKRKSDALALLARIGDQPAALDFETTGLHPAEGAKVRLISIATEDEWALIDCFGWKGGFKAIADHFGEAAWIVFNGVFEQKFFIANTDVPVTCWDVQILRRSVMGGGDPYNLKAMVKWDLKEEIGKEQQASDWGAEVLTKEQLDYAADDSIFNWELWQHWRPQADSGHMDCFNMFNDMIPGVVEMTESGMLIDVEQHDALVTHWEERRDDLVAQIRALEPGVENLDSRTQWSDWLAKILPDAWLERWPRTGKSGQLQQDKHALNDIIGLIHSSTPEGEDVHQLAALLALYRDYTKLQKYISSFGRNLIAQVVMTKTKAGKDKNVGGHLHPDGRLHAGFNIMAAVTGRFSSNGPNLQQIPRDLELLGEETSVRTSFIAAPGNVLVSYDYSGIELKVLALLSGDEVLLHDCVHGDVHAEVASFWAGRKIDKNNRDDKRRRQAAKGVSFGIVYGSGVPGLAGTMGVPMRVAQSLMDFWSTRYAKAFAYREQILEEAKATRFIRMHDGGSIYMGKRPSPTQCANYPVQRTAMSVMARALTRHKESLDALRAAEDPDGLLGAALYRPRQCMMLATIHDALITECHEEDADVVAAAMADDMTQAYLDIFPGMPSENLIEGGIGPDWGHLEDV